MVFTAAPGERGCCLWRSDADGRGSSSTTRTLFDKGLLVPLLVEQRLRHREEDGFGCRKEESRYLHILEY